MAILTIKREVDEKEMAVREEWIKEMVGEK